MMSMDAGIERKAGAAAEEVAGAAAEGAGAYTERADNASLHRRMDFLHASPMGDQPVENRHSYFSHLPLQSALCLSSPRETTPIAVAEEAAAAAAGSR